MRSPLAQLLAEAPVVTDGAWGTQLQALGLASGACADEWNLTHPDRVEQVAQSYVAAGSRIILTNTFRANRLALKATDLAEKIAEINQAGVAISRRAAAGRACVFASLGPSGKFLTGQVSKDELLASFTEQAQALAEAGADGLVIETMCDLDEALIALAAAKPTGLPVVVCLVFDFGPDRDRTRTGTTPEQAAEALSLAGAHVIGTNCGSIDSLVPICRRLRAATDRPLWIKPSAGLPQIQNGHLVYPTTPEDFARHAPALIRAGATFLGGCCGTNPEFIRRLRQSVSR